MFLRTILCRQIFIWLSLLLLVLVKTPAKKRVVQNLIDLIKQDVLLSPDEERIRKAN